MFEVYKNPNGTRTLKDLSVQECMHSYVGPWQEANQIYIELSNLESFKNFKDEICVYDVGMGTAANSLALIEKYEQLKKLYPSFPNLRILSFEKNLESLNLAIENKFDFLSPHISKLDELIKEKKWTNKSIHWELIKGDYFENIQDQPSADLVFYDFYSPKVVLNFWNVSAFSLIFEKIKKHPQARLITYCASTKVRTALLLSGFFVGEGVSTDSKKQTTVAAPILSAIKEPLQNNWLSKIERSSDPLPLDVEKAIAYQKLHNHFQFKN